jgi:N-acetylmuramoyl-L-alanine amidase
MRTINKIVIHSTATPEGRVVTVDEINSWHKERGFSEIGYHYVIYINGEVHKGRDIEKPGAHARGHNSNSIGIVYVGGVSKDLRKSVNTMTKEQRESLIALLKQLKKDYPDAVIVGHKDLAVTSCPSFDVAEFVKENGI